MRLDAFCPWALTCALVAAFAALAASPPAHAAAPPAARLETGDVVLIASSSAQAKAIAQATHSPYTHAGVVVVEDGGAWVYEAAGPVHRTPLARFLARAVHGVVAVRRAPGLDDDKRDRIAATARKYVGTPYDATFSAGAAALYCSEYVRVVLAGGGVDAGKVEHVRDLDVDAPAVRALVERRWRTHPACRGSATLAACRPKLLDAEIVTPASLAADPRLVAVTP